jgi:hypothetical protein
MGQTRKWHGFGGMSAMPRSADIVSAVGYVRFVPAMNRLMHRSNYLLYSIPRSARSRNDSGIVRAERLGGFEIHD